MKANKMVNLWITYNYNSLMANAKRNYSYLEKRGVSINELLNEAIVSIYDQKPFPKTEDDYCDAIKKSMNVIYFQEKEYLKDKNFTTRKGVDGDTYDLTEKKTNKIEELDPFFIKVCNIFHKARFGKKDERKICNNCGSKNLISIPPTSKSKREIFQCRACRRQMSNTSRTYFSNVKIKNTTLYRLVAIICRNSRISTGELSRRLGITQKTAWSRKRLIVAAHINSGYSGTNKTLYRLLTNKETDKSPLRVINLNPKILNQAQVNEMRRLFAIGYKTGEIAEIFNYDPSGTSKILKNKLYAS